MQRFIRATTRRCITSAGLIQHSHRCCSTPPSSSSANLSSSSSSSTAAGSDSHGSTALRSLTDAVTRLQVPPPTLPLPTVAVVYHHNDLRVHDHYALKLAQQRAAEGHEGHAALPVVAVLCLDVRLFAQPSLVGGFYRQSPQRAEFLLSTVAALRQSLKEIGVPLVIRTGYPEERVPVLLEELQCVAAFMTTQYAPHEKKAHDTILSKSGLRWSASTTTSQSRNHQQQKQMRTESGTCTIDSVWHSTLIHMDDLITPVETMKEGMRWYHDDMVLATVRLTKPYDVAPHMSKLPSLLPTFEEAKAQSTELPPYEGEVPSLEALGYGGIKERLAFQFTEVVATESSHTGGEAAAFERVEDWLQQDGMSSMLKLGRVKRTPYKMYSHKQLRVSPYLSVGALSPRKLYERVREHCIDNASDGMSQRRFSEFLLRLSRRDYWHWMGVLYGGRLFASYGPRPEHTEDIPDWGHHPKIVQRWCSALTGIPFVDASMRELVGTGFVSEPGRQAMAWLLTRGYGQDWRLAAEWLERCSLDYDPFSCYGNCAYFSEILKDDFGDPVYSATYLGNKHDQTGIYIKKWLPLLSKVPSVYIHRPHVLTEKMQKLHNVYLGKTYPYPIKLWDGADKELGPSQLTAYFQSKEQWAKPGVHEGLRFGRETVLPAAERSLTLAATAFEDMEEQYATVSAQQDIQQLHIPRQLVAPVTDPMSMDNDESTLLGY